MCLQKSHGPKDLTESFVVFGWLVSVVEEFIARVFKGGKVTIPKRLREICDVKDDDYVRLELTEVMKKEDGEWVKKKID